MLRPTRIEGLDLVRGLAILLVMIRHGWAEDVGGAGIVGVVMFFALSGYLITGVLLGQVERAGRPDFGRFYRDRAVRLLPAMVFMLGAFSVAVLTVDIGGDRDRWLASVIVALTYTADVPAFVAHASPALGHLWTLAVEEQFYVLWPLLLLVWIRRGRRGTRLAVLLLGLYASSFVGVVAVDEPRDAYVLPTSWAFVLLLGASARLYQDRVAAVLPCHGQARTTASLIALGVLLSIAFAPVLKSWLVTYLLLGPLIGAATIVLVFHLRDWRTVSGRWRPLLWLGTVSYAAYLWNGVFAVWLGGPTMNLSWWQSLVSIALTLVAAQVSLVVVERPARRWKSKDGVHARAGSRPPGVAVSA